ncbi:MAG: nucleotide exchange factor GrpE [Faecalibacterium sp.]|jgi:molecular chaperone GrpE|nr:nucleotide exchange factor GrpE [Faecalibacterium sp.]
MSEKEKQTAEAAEPAAETQAGQAQTAAPAAETAPEQATAEQAEPAPDAAPTPKAEEKAPEKKEKKDAKKAAELGALEAKLAAAEKKATEEKDQLLRTAAEYENFRKRSAREADQKFNDGISYAVTQIIPILDTLEMAAKAPCTDENFKKGVAMTLDKAAGALKTLNITELEAEGKPFDPNLMNAVSQVPAPEGVESGCVVTVYQKGYLLGDKIVRHATVVVAE